MNVPSYIVRKGDVISLSPSSKEVNKIAIGIQSASRRTMPSWLEANHAQFTGTIKDVPSRDEISLAVEESMIVEYYSR